MGTINKFANLYDKDGKLTEKAPIQNKILTYAPRQTKYPGGQIAVNRFFNEGNNN